MDSRSIRVGEVKKLGFTVVGLIGVRAIETRAGEVSTVVVEDEEKIEDFICVISILNCK
jgi:hypothetical protein